MTRPRSRRRQEVREQVQQDIEFAEIYSQTSESDDSIQIEQVQVEQVQIEQVQVALDNFVTNAPCISVPTTVQCWSSSDNEYIMTCNLYSTDDSTIVCPIMHEPPCSAQLEDIPSTWPLLDNSSANTVRLACAHVFFVPALVLHFLVTNMRCPVCRAGSSQKMNIACVPLDVRDSYLTKLSALQQRTMQEDMIDMLPEHISNVLSELELEMRIFTASPQDPTVLIHNATAKTRIVFDAQHVADIQSRSAAQNNPNVNEPQFPMITNFAVHRSFQRLIRGILGRHYLQQTPSSVCFALTHPLLPLGFKTNLMPVDQIWNRYFVQGASHVDVGIPFFCANIGGTEALAYMRCALCSISRTTSITIDVNMHVIINIISYVSDVLESIRAGVQEHLQGIPPYEAGVQEQLQFLDVTFPMLNSTSDFSEANADV